MRILRENTLGLIIDVQEKLFPHMAAAGTMEKNIIILLRGLKILEIPILVTEQYRKGLGPTITGVQEEVSEYRTIEKMEFSCCDSRNFMEVLTHHNKTNIVIAGIETHVCVMQTAVDLIGLKYQPVIALDCTSSRKAEDKRTAEQRMLQEGAIITSYESLLFELARASGTVEFRAISKLVKQAP